MTDVMNPQTYDDTIAMTGTVRSVAVETIGNPTVIFWMADSAGVVQQMNGSLETDAVSRLAMLQLLKDAVTTGRDVQVYYTVDTNDAKWFHFVRMY